MTDALQSFKWRIIQCSALSASILFVSSTPAICQVRIKTTNQVEIQLDFQEKQVGSWIQFHLEPSGLGAVATHDAASGQWIARNLQKSFVPEEQKLVVDRCANPTFPLKDYDFLDNRGELRNQVGLFNINSRRARWSIEVLSTPMSIYEYRRKTPLKQKPSEWQTPPQQQIPSIVTLLKEDSIDLAIYENRDKQVCLFTINNIDRDNLSGDDENLLTSTRSELWVRYKSDQLAAKILSERLQINGCPVSDKDDPYSKITQLVKTSGSGAREAESLALRKLKALIDKNADRLQRLDLCTPNCEVARR